MVIIFNIIREKGKLKEKKLIKMELSDLVL